MEATDGQQAELKAALQAIIDSLPSDAIDELCARLQEISSTIRQLLDRSDSVLVEQARELYRRGTRNIVDGGGDIATARMMLEELVQEWQCDS